MPSGAHDWSINILYLVPPTVNRATCKATTSDKRKVDILNSVFNSAKSTPNPRTTPPHRNVAITAAAKHQAISNTISYNNEIAICN